MPRALAPFVRKFALAPWVALLAAGATGLISAACGSAGASDTLPPITGVIVRAESLTTGRGCGRGPEQVFKYAAVLLGKSSATTFDRFIAGNVYDCFADGLFVDLPASGGSFDYKVQIYAYNEAAFTSAGAASLAAKAQTVTDLKTTNPTFTTTCNAVQIDLVQTLAVCKPLSLGTGGIDTTPVPTATAQVVLSTESFAGPDGGVLRCDADYAVVRSRYSVVIGGKRGALSQPVDTRCGVFDDKGNAGFATITIPSASAPAQYDFDIALVTGVGGAGTTSVRGETTCTAGTSPGLTSSAVCKPVP